MQIVPLAKPVLTDTASLDVDLIQIAQLENYASTATASLAARMTLIVPQVRSVREGTASQDAT